MWTGAERGLPRSSAPSLKPRARRPRRQPDRDFAGALQHLRHRVPGGERRRRPLRTAGSGWGLRVRGAGCRAPAAAQPHAAAALRFLPASRGRSRRGAAPGACGGRRGGRGEGGGETRGRGTSRLNPEPGAPPRAAPAEQEAAAAAARPVPSQAPTGSRSLLPVTARPGAACTGPSPGPPLPPGCRVTDCAPGQRGMGLRGWDGTGPPGGCGGRDRRQAVLQG